MLSLCQFYQEVFPILFLKPMNLEDARKEYDFLKATPSEQGFCNDYDETSYEDFISAEIPKCLAIAPAERRKGSGTRGLQLTLEACKQLLPPEEQKAYLSCDRDNLGSLGVMLHNGGYIHHSDDQEHYVRIPLYRN